MASSGNFCTINPIGAQGGGTTSSSALSSGNTAATIQTDTLFGNFGVTSGKWYWEWALTGSSTSGMAVGWANQQVNPLAELGYNSPSSATGAQIVYMYLSPSSGAKDIISDAPKSASSGTDSDSTGSVAQNDIISLAADFDNDKWYFAINGSYTAMRSGQNPSDGSNPMCSASGGGGLVTIARTAGYIWFPAMGNWAAGTRDIKVNFGQDSTFSGSFSAGGNADENGFGDFKYSVPTGFLAMCSANLPVSDDIDPAQTDTNYPGKQFNPVLYTGNGSDGHAITGVGFQPDLVWLKKRSASASNQLYDSSRGTGKLLSSDSTAAEATYSTVLQSFDSDGFTLGTSAAINGSSATMVGWCWKANGGTTASNSDGSITSTVQANTAAGFSIITYTGDENAGTIGHGLSAKPDLIFFKSRDTTDDWGVYHSAIGATNALTGLSSSAGLYNYTIFNNTEPTTSVITLGAAGSVGRYRNNKASTDYIAYCWHGVDGYSKFGKFEGNANNEGPYIYTGFRPRLLFIKNIDSSSPWGVYDTERPGFNDCDLAAWDEGTAPDNNIGAYPLDILSNGFKLRTSNSTVNSSHTWVFGAWGDVPFKYNNTF